MYVYVCRTRLSRGVMNKAVLLGIHSSCATVCGSGTLHEGLRRVICIHSQEPELNPEQCTWACPSLRFIENGEGMLKRPPSITGIGNATIRERVYSFWVYYQCLVLKEGMGSYSTSLV